MQQSLSRVVRSAAFQALGDGDDAADDMWDLLPCTQYQVTGNCTNIFLILLLLKRETVKQANGHMPSSHSAANVCCQ